MNRTPITAAALLPGMRIDNTLARTQLIHCETLALTEQGIAHFRGLGYRAVRHHRILNVIVLTIGKPPVAHVGRKIWRSSIVGWAA